MPHLRHRSPARARRAAALAAALLATGGLTACTAEQNTQTEDFTGAKGDVQRTVERLSTFADKDSAALICKELLGEQLVAAFGGAAKCEAGVQTAIDRADYTNLNVTAVDIDDAQVTAIARIEPADENDGRRALTLARADDKARWKIIALDPTGKATLPAASGTTPAGTTPGSTPKE